MSRDPAAATTAGARRSPGDPTGPEAPVLTVEQIRRELERLHQSAHRIHRSALFACLSDPAADGATFTASVCGAPVEFRVVSTSGELDLRCKLAREKPAENCVYVVPFARQLPRDVEAVLAGGRMAWPQIESLLPQRFGARSATPRLLHSRLRVVAQRDAPRVYGRGEAPSIDLDDAWMSFLRDRLGVEAIETADKLFAETLLDRDRRGKALGALLATVRGAREELGEVVERRLGSNAPLVLSAWLDDAAVELAAMAVVGEATRPVLLKEQGADLTLLTTVIDTEVLRSTAHPLKAVRDEGGRVALAKVLLELGYLVQLVWPRLEDPKNDHPLRRAILGEAEKTLVSDQVRPLALGSPRLPFVLEHRRSELIRALDASDVGAVDAAASALVAHESARSEAKLIEQIEMGARLSAFLAEPIPEEQASPHAELIRLSDFHAAVGGYVDWARQVVRYDSSTELGKALHRLVARVDEVRDALDARFARAYATLVGSNGDRTVLRGAAQVMGRAARLLLIEDAIAEMALGLLADHPDRKLLVLCMDGMSWANVAELWSTSKTSLVPVRVAPMLAHVPTITKVSRSALFAGRAIAPGESLDTNRDDDRLAKHEAIRQMRESSVVLLRGDILAQGGGLSDDARATVRGEGRIVAVVVNAIDDQLGGAAQLRVPISIDKIPALAALLEDAERTGRLVLLVSDHGNISSQRFYGAAIGRTSKDVDGAAHGARYRYLAASEVATADEIELPAGAMAVGKAERLAVAVKETLRYSPLLHAGEHGGASLAEAIAPAVLLVPPAIAEAVDQEIRAKSPSPPWGEGRGEGGPIHLTPPPFWSRPTTHSPRTSTAAPPSTPPRPSPAAPPPPMALTPSSTTPQGDLPFAPEPIELDLAEQLFRTKLFGSRLRSEVRENDRLRVRKAIELLVRAGNRMASDPFAVALGIDVAGRGSRVPGFLSLVERVLNVDQEPVVELVGQIITLDEPLLRALFLEGSGG